MKYDISIEWSDLTYIETYYHYIDGRIEDWSSFQTEQTITKSITETLSNIDIQGVALDSIINAILLLDKDYRFNDMMIFMDSSRLNLEFCDTDLQLVFNILFKCDTSTFRFIPNKEKEEK